MKVKELIEILRAVDPERVVVLASDAELNCCTEMDGYLIGMLDVDDGEIGLEELTDEDEEEGYTEEDIMGEDAIRSIVLIPM